jgi:hypothetical protein
MSKSVMRSMIPSNHEGLVCDQMDSQFENAMKIGSSLKTETKIRIIHCRGNFIGKLDNSNNRLNVPDFQDRMGSVQPIRKKPILNLSTYSV